MPFELSVALKKAAEQGLNFDDPTVLSAFQTLVSNVAAHPTAAACMIPLCKYVTVDGFLTQLKEGLCAAEEQCERRAMAIGLASLVKGLGLGGVRSTGIMSFLEVHTTPSW